MFLMKSLKPVVSLGPTAQETTTHCRIHKAAHTELTKYLNARKKQFHYQRFYLMFGTIPQICRKQEKMQKFKA